MKKIGIIGIAVTLVAVICVLIALVLSDDESSTYVEPVTSEPTPSVILMPTPSTPSEGIYINPPTQKVTIGQEFSIDIAANIPGQEISGAEIELEFNPETMEIIDVTHGSLFGSDPLIGIEDIDNEAGVLHYVLAQKGITPDLLSNGLIASVRFKVMDTANDGSCDLTLIKVNLTDSEFEDIINFKIQNGIVQVN